MWLSVVAMSLPNVFLFALAWEMVSNAFGVGQGIGVILAMISLPIITIIWPGPYPSIFDADFGIGFVISALMAPIPFFGLIGWLVGQLLDGRRPISTKSNCAVLESVRKHQAGLQSFRSMRRIEASRRNASALRLRFSQSLASLRQRLSQAKVRSTTQRRGSTTNPFIPSERLTISVSS